MPSTTNKPIGPSLITTTTALCAAVALGFFAGTTHALQPGVGAKSLFKTSTTIIGQPIVYPTGGPAQLTAVIVTIDPGAQTGWHKHAVPMFGYMLEGEISVDYGKHGRRIYRAGDALMEAVDTAHDGTNLGRKPARVLALIMSTKGTPGTIPVNRPPQTDPKPKR